MKRTKITVALATVALTAFAVFANKPGKKYTIPTLYAKLPGGTCVQIASNATSFFTTIFHSSQAQLNTCGGNAVANVYANSICTKQVYFCP